MANLNSNAVSLIDTATNQQVGDQIEVGAGPASVAITPDGCYAYTANVLWLTPHARVELAKRLEKVRRAPVRFRITFTPNGGTAKTVHRRLTLVRAPRHKHRGH